MKMNVKDPTVVKTSSTVKSDGGPSSYYDWKTYKTLNDYIEDKSKSQWGAYSFPIGNISKAIDRWGMKEGVPLIYDAKKVVYYGVRLLVMLLGKQEAKKYILGMMEDEQFND